MAAACDWMRAPQLYHTTCCLLIFSYLPNTFFCTFMVTHWWAWTSQLTFFFCVGVRSHTMRVISGNLIKVWTCALLDYALNKGIHGNSCTLIIHNNLCTLASYLVHGKVFKKKKPSLSNKLPSSWTKKPSELMRKTLSSVGSFFFSPY
jgi:hypothetical protein